jgi:hypothetical protein
MKNKIIEEILQREEARMYYTVDSIVSDDPTEPATILWNI